MGQTKYTTNPANHEFAGRCYGERRGRICKIYHGNVITKFDWIISREISRASDITALVSKLADEIEVSRATGCVDGGTAEAPVKIDNNVSEF